MDCKHKGADVGILGCSSCDTVPVYLCNRFNMPCVDTRPSKSKRAITFHTGQTDWFTAKNPACSTCIARENIADGNNQGSEL